MKTMEICTIVGMLLLPSIVFAATDCRIIEYPDHYEAVCVGDEKNRPEQEQRAMKAQIPVPVKTEVPAKVAGPSKAAEFVQTPVMAQTAVTPQATATAKTSVTTLASASPQSLASKSPVYIRLRQRQNPIRETARVSRARLLQEEQKQTDNPNVINSNQLDITRD